MGFKSVMNIQQESFGLAYYNITHWLEFEITRSLYRIHKDKLMLGEEMMESDNQLILNEYLQHRITSDRFEKEARLCPNYSTDYSPIVYFAKENEIPFIKVSICIASWRLFSAFEFLALTNLYSFLFTCFLLAIIGKKYVRFITQLLVLRRLSA